MSNVDNNSVNNVSASGEESRLELYVNLDWRFVNINDISISVPVEWSVRKIGDLCQLHGGVSAPKEFQQSGYPFIRVSNLHHDGINVGKSNTKEFLSGNWKTVPANTLLLAKSGESIRQHYRNITDEEAVIVGHIAGLEALPGNDIFFIRHHIRHYPFEESIILGGATPTIGLRGISNVQIRVAERAEQTLIAQALSTQEAQVADLRKLAALERQRLTWLSDELLSGRLRVVEDPTAEPVVVSRDESGEPVEVLPGVRLVENREWKSVEVNGVSRKIPTEWRCSRIEALCHSIGSGRTPPKSGHVQVGTPWLTISDISGERINYERAKKIDNSILGLREAIPGDVLFSIYGSIGETHKVDRVCTTNQAILILKVKENADFLVHSLRYNVHDMKASEARHGVQANLSLGIVSGYQLVWSEEQEQSLIAAVLTAQEKQAAEIERLADLEQKRLEWLSDELLSGRLRIKVPAETKDVP